VVTISLLVVGNREGFWISSHTLIKHIREKLPALLMPNAGHYVCNENPYNASG